MGSLYVVRGCGIAAICSTEERILYWIKEILERGGVPTIEEINETDL